MAWAHCLVEDVSEGASTEAVQGGHGVSPQDAHQPPGEAAVHPNPCETLAGNVVELVAHLIVPGRVVSIEKFHAPGLSPTAQPAVLFAAFARDAGIRQTEFPVCLAAHLYLPVVAALAEALPADGIEGGVKTGGGLWEVLPGLCVRGQVSRRGDGQFRVGSIRVKDNF